jgi:SAM-dependent methyltransferase
MTPSTSTTVRWKALLFLLLFQAFPAASFVPTSSTPKFTDSRVSSPNKKARHASSILQDTEQKRRELVNEFVSRLLDAVNEKSFVSVTLRGIKKKVKKNNNSAETTPDLRGSIRQVQGRLIQVKQAELLQLTLKYHGATDICKNFELNEIPSKLPEMMLNPLASEWGLEAVRANPIQGAELKTSTNIWDLQLNNKAALVQQRSQTVQPPSGPTSHDRTKSVPVSTKADFLQALGVTKPDGKPRPGMKSKLRQCQKFVEIVGGLVDKLQQVSDRPISVVDMGCGRGYLTFALHKYLSDQYDASQVHSEGIDVRPKLVAEISGIAGSLGGSFDTLTFRQGTIENVVQEAASFEKPDGKSLDILIALHACDTATDDALWSGICRSADLMVVAPCCHKQIRPQLDAHFTSERDSHPLVDVLKHGIYRERISETVTDSLRALLLELAGYKVQVFEFIGGEHTSKNVMITAVKSKSEVNAPAIRARILALAAFHGIRKHKLAEWAGENLGTPTGTSSKDVALMAALQMPPREGGQLRAVTEE